MLCATKYACRHACRLVASWNMQHAEYHPSRRVVAFVCRQRGARRPSINKQHHITRHSKSRHTGTADDSKTWLSMPRVGHAQATRSHKVAPVVLARPAARSISELSRKAFASVSGNPTGLGWDATGRFEELRRLTTPTVPFPQERRVLCRTTSRLARYK